MTQGLANTATLYDKDGNPVTVSLEAGEYRLVVTDHDGESALSAIKELLVEIRDLLTVIKENQ